MNQDLLHNYFKGETSVDEEKRILNWVDESEENRKTLQKERMLFDIALFTDSKRKMREKAGAGARIIPMLRWSEKYYNVKITVENPKVLNYRCTGKFKEQDGVEHILKVIQKDHPFTYSISEEGDSIRIE